MDLAIVSGLLVTSSEDGFVRVIYNSSSTFFCNYFIYSYTFSQVWQLSQKGHVISHRFSQSIPDCLMNGVKFLDNRGAAFAITSYDSNRIQMFKM